MVYRGSTDRDRRAVPAVRCRGSGNDDPPQVTQCSKLVTYGIFGWSRNPLYNGNFLVWIGFCVISGVLWFLPFAVLIFAAEYSLIVRYEEGVLESIFGRQYLDYKNFVPRWLPRKPDEPSRGEHDWRQAFKSEISTFAQYAVLIVAFAIKGYFTR
jgi:hypothetical protein